MSAHLPSAPWGRILSLSVLFLTALPAQAEVVMTFGGDFNLTQNRAFASPEIATKHDRRATWDQLYAGIAPLLDGHLNFANVETVVSPNAALQAIPEQTFAFRAHPQGIDAAIRYGFNMFSMANNHTGDYGIQGIVDTIQSMEQLSAGRPVFWSGVAMTRAEALRPALIPVRTSRGTVTIAFLSMTAIMRYDYRARDNRAGVLRFYDESDFRDGMRALREVRADYRVLSVHWGREGSVEVQPEQRRWAHRALSEGDVDLLLGHHPHRVQPVERVGHRLIYYSLGNYLMLGAANLNGRSTEHNYGLMGKVYLSYDASLGRLVPQAAEAIPLTELHFISRPLTGNAAHERISSLNAITQRQFGSAGLRFTVGHGKGSACLGDRPEARGARVCAQAAGQRRSMP